MFLFYVSQNDEYDGGSAGGGGRARDNRFMGLYLKAWISLTTAKVGY